MRAAILARVSTKDQQSIPMQIEAAQKYCESRGWQIVKEIEEKQSGKRSLRPLRAEIIEMAKKGKIDVVIVWKLNRWGRDTTDILLTINELMAWNVSFVSICENLDFTTPMGRLMAGILAVFAQFERENIVHNVKTGIAASRKKKAEWGRPPKTRAKKDQVMQLKAEGVSPTEIAKRLSIGRASVYRLLQEGS
jgi:putative DNA-invertase from lambdoid prophage Rac